MKIKSALLLTTLLIAPSYSYAEDNIVPAPTIMVSATGETQAEPDMAILNLAIVTHDKTAQAALTANNEAMNKVIENFRKNGIDKKDLQTSGLSIYQIHTEEKNAKRSEQPYQVSNALTIRIRKLDTAGQLFDTAMNLGVNNVNGLNFTNADPKPYLTKARENAVNEALEKAATLARAANVKLGRIIKISENETGPIIRQPMASMVRSADFSDSAFASGELNYKVTVTATFAIDE